jgi:hypothetical protein
MISDVCFDLCCGLREFRILMFASAPRVADACAMLRRDLAKFQGDMKPYLEPDFGYTPDILSRAADLLKKAEKIQAAAGLDILAKAVHGQPYTAEMVSKGADLLEMAEMLDPEADALRNDLDRDPGIAI